MSHFDTMVQDHTATTFEQNRPQLIHTQGRLGANAVIFVNPPRGGHANATTLNQLYENIFHTFVEANQEALTGGEGRTIALSAMSAGAAGVPIETSTGALVQQAQRVLAANPTLHVRLVSYAKDEKSQDPSYHIFQEAVQRLPKGIKERVEVVRGSLEAQHADAIVCPTKQSIDTVKANAGPTAAAVAQAVKPEGHFAPYVKSLGKGVDRGPIREVLELAKQQLRDNAKLKTAANPIFYPAEYAPEYQQAYREASPVERYTSILLPLPEHQLRQEEKGFLKQQYREAFQEWRSSNPTSTSSGFFSQLAPFTAEQEKSVLSPDGHGLDQLVEAAIETKPHLDAAFEEFHQELQEKERQGREEEELAAALAESEKTYQMDQERAAFELGQERADEEDLRTQMKGNRVPLGEKVRVDEEEGPASRGQGGGGVFSGLRKKVSDFRAFRSAGEKTKRASGEEGSSPTHRAVEEEEAREASPKEKGSGGGFFSSVKERVSSMRPGQKAAEGDKEGAIARPRERKGSQDGMEMGSVQQGMKSTRDENADL